MMKELFAQDCEQKLFKLDKSETQVETNIIFLEHQIHNLKYNKLSSVEINEIGSYLRLEEKTKEEVLIKYKETLYNEELKLEGIKKEIQDIQVGDNFIEIMNKLEVNLKR